MHLLDVSESLRVITSRCLFVRTPSRALRLVPDLGLDGPPLFLLPREGSSEMQAVIPASFTEVIADPLARLLSARLHALLNGDERENVTGRDAAAWFAEPLVGVLTRLLCDTWRSSPRFTAIPLLELARITGSLLHGHLPPGVVASESTRAIDKNLPRIREMEPLRRAALQRELAWSLTARIGAAWSCAALVLPEIRPNRFYQALLQSRMTLVTPPPPLGTPSIADAMAMLEIPGDPVLMDRFLALVETMLLAVESRREAGQSTQADGALLGAFFDDEILALPGPERVRVLARDPELIAHLLHGLEQHGASKHFSQAGLSKEQVRLLTNPQTLAPLDRACRDLLQGLHRWDLLAGVLSLLEPVGRRVAEIRSESLEWTLLAPSGRAGGEAAVVALRVSELRDITRVHAERLGDSLCEHAFDGLLDRFAELARARGAIAHDLGSHLVLACDSTRTAVDLAFQALLSFSTPLRLQLGPQGAIEIPRGPTLSVGIAFGPVRFQGTPGSRLLIRGLALDDALRLAGDGDPGEIQDDPLEMRGAVRRPEGLFSRGVVASAGFLLRHKEQQSRRGIPYWRPGSTESVAGIDTAFCFYPVRFSQEESPSSVIYMVALDNAEHAPLEVRRLPTNDFQHFHIQDATLGPLGAPSSSSSSSSSKGLRAEEPAFGHGAGFDPFSAPSEESPARTSRSYPEDLGDISTPATSPLPPTSRMPPPPLRPSRRAPPPPPIKSLQPINALLEIEDDDENDEFDTPDADTSDEGILLDGTEELPLPSRAATAPRARPTGAFDPPSGPVLGYLPPEHFGKVETPDPMEDATEDSFSFAVPADILDEAPPTRSSDSAVSTGSASMAPPPAPPPAAADDEIREVHFELPEDVELTDPELHSSSGPPLEPLAPAPGLDLEDLMATDERDVFIEASQLSSMRSEAFREQLAASREPPLAAHRPAPISHSPSPPPASDDLYASLANLLDTDAFDASPSERPIEPVADAPLAPGLEEALDADDSEFADLLGQTLAEAERGGEPRPIEADAFGSFVQEPPPTQDFELPPPPTAAPMHEFGDPEPTETVAAPAAPAAPTAGASGRFSALRGTMIRDLGHVFANYRLYRTPQGEWLFGHHHGRQVLDAHRYDATHDLTQACTAFLKEKVAEGFVLRGDRLQTVPANSTHEKLDLDLLGRIFREMTEA